MSSLYIEKHHAAARCFFYAKKRTACVFDAFIVRWQVTGKLDELNALKERAAYFGLDKTKDFEEFKRKVFDGS